jgi:divalent metal cation (Fe/Co/Zn/Cd) transporter
MDEHLYDEIVEDIRKESVKVDGIIDTEKCHVRKVGMQFQVDLHAIVSGEITVSEGHKLSHDLKNHLLETIPSLGNVLIHIEPDEENN